MKTKRILLGLLLFFPAFIFAQTITNYQSFPGTITSSNMGQSFTSTLDGFLTQVDIQPGMDVSNVTLLIYSSADGSGTFNDREIPDYEQTGVNLSDIGSGPTDWYTVALSTPFPIVSGQQYTFIFEGNLSLSVKPGNPYPGGTYIGFYGDINSDFDINFRVWESAPAPTPLKTWPFILLFIIPFAFIIVRKMR